MECYSSAGLGAEDSLIILERREVLAGTAGAEDCKPCFFDNLSSSAWRIDSSKVV